MSGGGAPEYDVVLAHDYLGQFGGAERVVEEMCGIFPDAPIYTSYYSPERTFDFFRTRDVRTTFLDKAPGIGGHHKAYLALYPLAFSRLRLPSCRVVLSSSTSFAKGVPIPQGAAHVCYCNSPMRFAWDFDSYVEHDSGVGGMARAAARIAMGPLRRWDLATNDAVDIFIANSHNIADRIKRIYGRDSVVVYPPVAVDDFEPSAVHDDYYLVVSRLAGYKRVDLAVKACTQTGRRLIVVGDGPVRASLEQMAGPTVEFLGRASDEEVRTRMARCRALLFCGEEDFGITPVEAMACGRPVVAYGAGGAVETVVDGVTGVHFGAHTVESLIAAIERLEATTIEGTDCVRRAHEFAPQVFRARLLEIVAAAAAGNPRESALETGQ
ncbi:MAG: glycosyltransferase family 4 protein [Coriobacteriia bacterium]|nr:glycosyltransferase family 4 protein [Coriobacteriia bacterium]